VRARRGRGGAARPRMSSGGCLHGQGRRQHAARPARLCPEHGTRTKTSQGKRAWTDGLVHGLKAFCCQRDQVEALHARRKTASLARVHVGHAGRPSWLRWARRTALCECDVSTALPWSTATMSRHPYTETTRYDVWQRKKRNDAASATSSSVPISRSRTRNYKTPKSVNILENLQK
jgi:hypothetical protein